MKKLLSLTCLSLLSTGCLTKSIASPMKQSASTPSTTAPADKARVLVFRPGRMAGKMLTHHVIDGDKAFLGDAFNDSVFAADVSPGDHQFCIGNGTSSGPTVQAKLAAGKTYLLRVDIAFGYPVLTPVKPNTDDMKEAQGQLAGTRGSELLGPNAEDAPNADDVKTIYQRCAERAKDTSADDLKGFVLAEGDAM